MVEKLLTKIFGKKCAKCGSRDTHPDYYIRGYNNNCKQDIVDEGIWCNGCCRVTFDQTLEQFKQDLPYWCEVYEN